MNIQQEMILALEMAIKEIGLKSLSPSLREKIEQFESQLSEDNYQDQEIEQTIYDILNQDSSLYQAYEDSHGKVTQGYSSQERDKLVLTSVANESVTLSLPLDSSLPEERVTDSKELSILKALDIRSLTIENLMYRLNLSEDQVIELIKKLWNEGKIDTARGNLLGKYIPRFRNTKMKPDDYFTLTFKGQLEMESLKKIKS